MRYDRIIGISMFGGLAAIMVLAVASPLMAEGSVQPTSTIPISGGAGQVSVTEELPSKVERVSDGESPAHMTKCATRMRSKGLTEVAQIKESKSSQPAMECGCHCDPNKKGFIGVCCEWSEKAERCICYACS